MCLTLVKKLQTLKGISWTGVGNSLDISSLMKQVNGMVLIPGVTLMFGICPQLSTDFDRGVDLWKIKNQIPSRN